MSFVTFVHKLPHPLMGYQIRKKIIKKDSALCGCPRDKCCSLVGRGDEGASVLKAGPVVSIAAMLKSFSRLWRLVAHSFFAALTSFSILKRSTSWLLNQVAARSEGRRWLVSYKWRGDIRNAKFLHIYWREKWAPRNVPGCCVLGSNHINLLSLKKCQVFMAYKNTNHYLTVISFYGGMSEAAFPTFTCKNNWPLSVN